MHLGDCNKEDLHKKPLLLFLKVISVCMHVVFTCVCACACACSLAAVWVCRSLRLSWEFAGPLTDSLTFSRTYPSGFASIPTSLRMDLVSRMIPFPPQVCRWCSVAKCDNGGTMTQKEKKLQNAQSWKNGTWPVKTTLPKTYSMYWLLRRGERVDS